MDVKVDEKIRDRFFKRVAKEKDQNACWLWLGAKDAKGYGQFCIGAKQYRSHRIAFILAHGRDIPRGRELHHTCRKRDCCNPAHLEVVSHAKNMKLAAKAGAWSGMRNSNARRTEEQVHQIRVFYKAGLPMTIIAQRLNIPLRSCYSVLEGHESWQHIKTLPEHVEKLFLGEGQI